MFIEAFEPLHIYGIVCFLIFISFLIGIMIGSTSEKDNKKAN